MLLENEHAIPFSAQPDLPGAAPLSTAGSYLVYLDVWQRHLTALETPTIREVALGGPDTATRTRTVWQARSHSVPGGTTCLTDLSAWDALLAGSTGTLMARAQPEVTSTDPCIVPASAGFRGLQNQLYRVEIHTAGGLNSATFKWSRDNGSVIFAVDEFLGGQPTDRVRMRSLGRDNELAIRKGDWVEVLDDNNELTFTPGALVQVVDLDTDDLILTLSAAVSGFDMSRHPKVRRWDSTGTPTVSIPGTNDGFIELEDGVEVKFSAGAYQNGDYWLIPARTILGNPALTQTGGIEWPMDASSQPVAQTPEGIQHSYCRLAILVSDGTAITQVSDCRPIFPPATELVELFYLGGDGQEAMPGEVLAHPLRAGVSNGEWPVADARVRFQILEGSGTLSGGGGSGNNILVLTDASGIASVTWQLDSTTQNQLVEARLEDVSGDPHHLMVHYSANLSVASQVAYTPGCEGLQEADTVQEAIDELCRNVALYYVGGDGQSAPAGGQLPFPLEVRLANGHWPLAGEKVMFQVVPPGSGTLVAGASSGGQVEAITDNNGLAACTWTLDSLNPAQQVVAFWERQPDLFIHFNGIVASQQSIEAIHIVDLLIGGKPLELDALYPVAALTGGILIQLDQAIDPITLRDRLACTVTVDMPFPIVPADVQVFGNTLAGFQPLVLAATLEATSGGAAIQWGIGQPVANFLFRLLSLVQGAGFGRAVVAHLHLKGNFIYSIKDPGVYVDSDAVAVRPNTTPTGLHLPSGDEVRGGLFETWFRIAEG